MFLAWLTLAATWDPDLAKARGLALVAEPRAKGINVLFGQVIGTSGRSPYDGRFWEGFVIDPALSGVLAAETVSGMQKSGVLANLTHYTENEQETARSGYQYSDGTMSELLSSNLYDETMHELYLWPFADAVRAGAASVMCSYNRVNGSQACANSKILNGLLKTELGFQVWVLSDYGAVHSGVASANAGLEINLPGGIDLVESSPSFWRDNLTAAVQNFSVSVAPIDDMVTRIMTPYFHFGQDEDYPLPDGATAVFNVFDKPFDSDYTLGPSNVPLTRAQQQESPDVIEAIRSAGVVLLNNSCKLIPLDKPSSLGIFGNGAGELLNGESGIGALGLVGNEFGTLPVGGGSGGAIYRNVITPLEAISARARQDETYIQTLLNNSIILEGPRIAIPGINIALTQGLGLNQPIPEVCLLFLEAYRSEGADATTFSLDWNADAVVEAVSAYCNHTVVFTRSGADNVMPWAFNPNVTPILAAPYSGDRVGKSLVDVLYGDANPSGRLPYTIAQQESDWDFVSLTNLTTHSELANSTDPWSWQSNFTEGVLVNYRHFDYYDLPVQYEFGYGLSYTTFEIGTASIERVGPENLPRRPTGGIFPGDQVDLYDALFTVRAPLKNTGSRDGAAVV